MKLQYLKRVYLHNKAVKKIDLPRQYIPILFTIYLLDPGTYTTIYTTLKRVNKLINKENLSAYLKYLLAAHLIHRDGNNYTVTPEGLTTLKDIERRLRIERHDR